MSLANKYRPQTFDEVIDQSHIVDILKYQVSHWQTSQTYIFFGPRGTGKTSTARILSKAINCLQVQEGNPCNKCINCQTITANKSVDFVEIDAASHTGVDNIREEIVSKASYPPMGLKKKIYLIDEVHMLSKGAFNSLLKIMEETPEYMIFVLATTEINKVPETILSRCQIFNFTKVTHQDMVKHLAYICDAEWLQYEQEALLLIASIADWCVRDAVKYVDQVSVGWTISVQNASKYIWVASQSMVKGFLEILESDNFQDVLNYIQSINQSGIDLYSYNKQLLSYIDQHYDDDVAHMSQYAQLCSTILIQQKYYPNPILAYKVELRKYHQSMFPSSPITPSPSDLTVPNQEDTIKITHTNQPIHHDTAHIKDTSIDLQDTPNDTPNSLSSDANSTTSDTIHLSIYSKLKKSVQKMIWQAWQFRRSEDTQSIELIMIDSGKVAMIRRPDVTRHIEEVIQAIVWSYALHIIYHDPQSLLDQAL